MNESWLDQWVDRGGDVLRRAKADIEKVPGGGNTSLAELKAYIAKKGGGAWTLLETMGDYIVIKSGTPLITKHLGQPTLR
jgi:hypothetical protein